MISVLFILFTIFNFSSPEKYAVKFQSESVNVETFAKSLDLSYLSSVNRLKNVHIFESSSKIEDLSLMKKSFEESIVWMEEITPHKYRPIPNREPDISERWEASDPKISSQWHLMAVKAIEAWDLGYSGKGMVVSVLDDGVNRKSSELGNLDLSNSYNYVSDKNDPSPISSDCISSNDPCSHGTFCATLSVGESNDYCGSGIAPNSKLQGFCIMPTETSTSVVTINEYVDGVLHEKDVSSNSYGPITCELVRRTVSCDLAPLTNLEGAAFDQCLEDDRNGKGSILLFAAGNDGDLGEDTNLQGVLTQRGIMAIGASGQDYLPTYWSAPGAGLMIVAPGLNIFGSTIDIGRTTTETCRVQGSGTSYSTPIASGSVALILEANPRLSWRDVQHILVRSSYRVPTEDWVVNSANRSFSYTSGFGHLDVLSAVNIAKRWSNVGPERKVSNTISPKTRMTPGTIGIIIPIDNNIFVESVNLILDINVDKRGGLKIYLVSPSGTTHIVLNSRPDQNSNYLSWRTLVRGFWDEPSKGEWMVIISKDDNPDPGQVILNSFTLEIYGSSPSDYPSDNPEGNGNPPIYFNAVSKPFELNSFILLLIVILNLFLF